MNLRRPLPLLLLTGLAGAFAGLLVARMLSQKSVVLQGGTWLPEPRAVAPFSLTDLQGRSFSNPALLGHPSLLFFGYSSCPDICPTTLATIQTVLRSSPRPALQVLFVTIDPERDTPATLEAYLHAFGGHVVGLYGSEAALAPLERSLGALPGRRGGTAAGYRIDHTATLYLIDAKGRMAAVFTPPLTAAALGADLATLAQASIL
jgi:protein SCO1/2